jgi:hypothetical protein
LYACRGGWVNGEIELLDRLAVLFQRFIYGDFILNLAAVRLLSRRLRIGR